MPKYRNRPSEMMDEKLQVRQPRGDAGEDQPGHGCVGQPRPAMWRITKVIPET
jgi:hypothetical protein